MRDCAKVDLSLRGPGKCIDALSKKGTQPVSYGGSKPIQNFKDLLGDCRRGLMIAAVTLSKVRYLEACNTLNYAERAVQMKPQANTNVLNANEHISVCSALIEEYKEKVGGIQLTCEKAATENTSPETEVGELKDGLALMTVSRNALLRPQETGGGDSCQARCNNALSTTPVASFPESPGVLCCSRRRPANVGRMRRSVGAILVLSNILSASPSPGHRTRAAAGALQ
ncbi:hypothetical protein HPB49_002026 [Dermacentor silvarum]|uniref:Uncharacterized protein n=1 Tax=Dermacentor silvarum TaxID=543639 RepID=A0ACB8DTP9_DERSI|nr:hypothetical protein HPB49_002026 [Dermacentor silvarum]